MSIEEFNNTRFGNGMKVIYKGVENNIVSVDFEESLIGIGEVDEGDIYWIRCENASLLKPDKQQ